MAARLLLVMMVSLASLVDFAGSQPVPDSGGGFTWSVYYPKFVPLPLDNYIETGVGGMVQPSLALGGNGTHPQLITQDYSSHPLVSRDGGFSWTPLCGTISAHTTGAGSDDRVTPFAGRPAGIGMLRDGTLLLGTGTQAVVNGAHPCASNPWLSNCTAQVYIFRITVSAAGHCRWGAPHQLPTLSAGKPCAAGSQHCDNVGGDASNRFRVSPSTGDIYYTGTNLRSPAPGRTLPPSEQYDYSVCYKSTDAGVSFAPAGVIGRHIAEVDILPLPPSPFGSTRRSAGSGGAAAADELLASIRYQQSQPIDAAGDPVSPYC
eukprot:COSAG05_NODE_5868_length_1069_cov_1.689691_1_plen_317_part_01